MAVSLATRTFTQTGTDANLSALGTAITGMATIARSTAYSVGNVRAPTTANGFWYQCTTAGTSAASAPTFGTTDGGTTTDGTVVWTARKAPSVITTGATGNIRTEYKLESFNLNITGTLTQDPDDEQLTFVEVPTSTAPVLVNGSGVYNLGVKTTKSGVSSYSKGLAIMNSKALGSTHGFNGTYTNSAVIFVNAAGATCNWRGGVVLSPVGIRCADGTFNIEEGVFDCPYNSSSAIQPVFMFNAAADSVSLANLTINNNTAKCGLTIQIERAVSFSNVTNFFGGGIGTGGSTIEAPAGTSTELPVEDYAPKGDGLVGLAGTRCDYTYWRNNYLHAINALDGMASPCAGMNFTTNDSVNIGLINFSKRCAPLVKDALGAAVQDALVFLRDTNNGDRPASYRGQSWTADRTYNWTTDSGGAAASQLVLIGCKVKRVSGTPFDNQEISYRGPNGAANDIFTFSIWSYRHLYAPVPVNLRGNGVAPIAGTLSADATIVQSSRATVAAYTTLETLDKVRDFAKYSKTLVAFVELPTVSTEFVAPSGSVLGFGSANVTFDNAAGSVLAYAGGLLTVKAATLAAGSKYLSIAGSGQLIAPACSEGMEFDGFNRVQLATIPTAATIKNSALGLRITAPGTYDLSDWTFSGNTADVTVADGTGAVTIKTGGAALNISQGTGNTVTIDNTVPFVLSFAVTGGTLAMQNIGKFNEFKGVYASHAAAQAALTTPVLADYYAVDANADSVREEHGYWNGSAWIVHASGVITEHEILATSNGGAGVGATVSLGLLEGQQWRIYADKIGYFPSGYPNGPISITVPAGGGSKDIVLIENPTTIGISAGSYTTAQPLAASATLLPADSNSVMTLKMPTLAGQTTDVHFAFVELMRSSLENARGALAANSNKCVEAVDYIVKIADDTLRVLPLDSLPAGSEVMFEVPIVLDNYTIKLNPLGANNNRVCVTTFPRTVVVGGTVLGTVAVNPADKAEIKNHVTAMSAAL